MKIVYLLLSIAVVSSVHSAELVRANESGITLTYSYSVGVFGGNVFHVRANGLGFMAGVRSPNTYSEDLGGSWIGFQGSWGERRYRDLVTEGALAYKPSQVDWILFYLGGGVIWTDVRTFLIRAQRNKIVESNLIDESHRRRWYPVVGVIGKVFKDHRLLYQVGFDFSGAVLGIGYSF